MKKYASMQVLSAVLAPTGGKALRTFAHRHSFQYDPRPGFLYVRSRAISSRCNDNFDEFPAEEIKKAYATFVGKPVFVNHHNDNHRRARGVIIDAALHEDRNPDGTPDTWAEVLMEVDAVRFPKLAKAILAGHVDRTSMGTDVAYSECSVCNNRASNPSEYCAHIPKMKGMRVYRTTASGKKEGVLVRERCYGLGFFENSLLVEEPADPTAYFLGVDDHSGLSATASKARTAGVTDAMSAGEEISVDFSTLPVFTPRTAARPGVNNAYRRDPDTEATYGGMHMMRSVLGGDEAFRHGPEASAHLARGDQGRAAAAPDSIHSQVRSFVHRVCKQHGVEPPEVHVATSGSGFAGEVESLHDVSGGKKSIYLHPQMATHSTLLHEVAHHLQHSHLSPDETLAARRANPDGHHDERFREIFTGLLERHHPYGSNAAALFHMGHEDTRDYLRSPEGQAERQQDHEDEEYGVHDPLPTFAPSPKAAARIERLAARRKSLRVDPQNPAHRHLVEEHGVEPHRLNSQSAEELHSEFPECARKTSAVQEVISTFASLMETEASKADDFFKENEPHSDHIVNRFLAATPEEHDSGMNWYKDSHNIAKAIGKGDTAKAAGLMGVYSSGTPVAPNYHYASRALIHNAPVGGKSDLNLSEIPEEHHDFHGKPNASESQRDQARRMLNGEHHSKVLTSPKISNYAHLIEHGDDEPGHTGPGRVVVDRHAISAAINRRITDKEFSALNVSQTAKKGDYGNDGNARVHKVANVYREATDRLRAMGHDVKPHQVQAVAWTVQKRLNDADDEKNAAESKKAQGQIGGRKNSQDRQRDAWEKHVQTQHPDAKLPDNPRGHWGKLAYGETVAPAQVDTLRDENCPVCGESDSFDGDKCMVCGFDVPPKMFQDPDVSVAQQTDLRQDEEQALDPGADLNGDGMPDSIPGSTTPGSDNTEGVNPDDLAGDNAAIQGQEDPADQDAVDPDDLDGDGQVEPALVCPACGYQEETAPPQSVDTDDPGAPPQGLSQGDLCPNCGTALVEGEQNAEEQGQDPDAAPVQPQGFPTKQ